MADSITGFFQAWGETDAGARDTALRACLADGFTYVDPRAPEPISDAEALVAYVAMYTEYAPGATARVGHLSECKGHHLATVVFEMADGMRQHGQYFIELDGDGRLVRLIGFAGLGAPE